MTQPIEIAVFEGDGIGPEIMHPTVELLHQLAERSKSYALNFKTYPAGATHYARSGESLPKASLQGAKAADAILLSAMGLPSVRYPDGTEISPQIELRKEMNLYAGVRPVRVTSGQNSPLKLPKGAAIDFVLIRESTEGLFWSQGKGEVCESQASEKLVISKDVSEKLFRFSFKLAERRKKNGLGKGQVTCVDKANVFRAFAYFRDLFDTEAEAHPELNANHAYVDAMALWMVQKPWEFDVVVTENMFGDILSDLGAGLMGGLGLAPSADIGDEHAVFQPCHGSAPDIAGKGIANPFAMILSAAMMLRWSFGRADVADAIEGAVRSTLDDGIRTNDLMGADGAERGWTEVGTTAFAAAVAERVGSV